MVHFIQVVKYCWLPVRKCKTCLLHKKQKRQEKRNFPVLLKVCKDFDGHILLAPKHRDLQIIFIIYNLFQNE